jgi:hypothetical protein
MELRIVIAESTQFVQKHKDLTSFRLGIELSRLQASSSQPEDEEDQSQKRYTLTNLNCTLYTIKIRTYIIVKKKNL